MDFQLSTELSKQIEQEVARGQFRSRNELIELAIRQFLNDRQRSQRRLEALRRIGQSVDDAGLYDRVLLPGLE